MIIIRADGNSAIGMGHVMRCLSIAAAMKEKPTFVTACAECRPIIEERGYGVIVLPTDYRKMEEELAFLENIAAEKPASAGERHVFLVDSYQVTEGYFRELGRLGAVACLEDMGVSYPVELLINYNLYGPDLKYEEGLYTLLGTAYAPLRREFAENRDYKVRKQVKNVLISTGGGDPFFAAAGFLEVFLKEWQGSDNPVFHVVSGPMNTYVGELKARYNKVPCVRIHEKVSDMKELMDQCDVALAAAGSTVYELCSVGIPMICFYFAENQRQGAERLAEKTEIINAGNYAEDAEGTVERAGRALRKYILDYEYRCRLWSRERQLVDGQGAMRIAKELCNLGKTRRTSAQGR